MDFKTAVKIENYPFKISHKDTLFCIGSCFSDEMGKRLEQSKFNITNNPFGVLFHPLAIENALDRIMNLTLYEPYEIIRYNELYFSWDHSSIYNEITEEETLTKINNSIIEANEKIQEAKVFIITLATSWAYLLKKAELFVANCHKVPGSEFDKVLLAENEIENSLKKIIDRLNDLPHATEIIFTVSPVRHLRDGLIENNISKGRLLNAVYKMTKSNENVHYFPSYEILLDELRDYRFYTEDMLHPSKQAIEYIWQKFNASFFLDSTKELVNKAQKIAKLEEHRALHPSTLAHKKFMYDSLKQIEELEKEFRPNAFKSEIERIKQRIKNVN